jgi:hypothetical protein
LVLILVYAASLSSLLHTLAEPREKALVAVMLGAGLLGLALFVLDLLPLPLLDLRLTARLAELSRGSRRLFAKPAR